MLAKLCITIAQWEKSQPIWSSFTISNSRLTAWKAPRQSSELENLLIWLASRHDNQTRRYNVDNLETSETRFISTTAITTPDGQHTAPHQAYDDARHRHSVASHPPGPAEGQIAGTTTPIGGRERLARWQSKTALPIAYRGLKKRAHHARCV